MTTAPLHPEHTDTTKPIPGADPRFAIRRVLSGYAYPANGNVHNPTPRYHWHLLLDGRLVDLSHHRGPLVQAAKTNGVAPYLAG
jgi:hypothetical protein